jgi:transcriptional regulator with XRE-family HTH domain
VIETDRNPEPGRPARRVSRRRITDDALRDACARAVGHRTLRSVASDIGVSPPTLSQFLAGSKPHSATLQKFRDWFYSGVVADWLTPEHVEASLAEFLSGLAEPGGAKAAAQICEIVRAAHTLQGTPVPRWVDGVLERLRGGTLRGSRTKTPIAYEPVLGR